MEALSVREYRNNLAASFTKADNGEQVLIRRKNEIYALVKVGREDLMITPELHQILSTVYQALEEKGYNPINQIVGYILSEDPTYITNHNNARTLIRKIDRDELLQVLVRKYLGQ